MRLDAKPETAQQGDPVAYGHNATCLECNATYRACTSHSEFCSTLCRRAFNNRRALRGAELYDLFMAHRFERPRAQALRLLGVLNRMASNYRAQDRDQRGGRHSWRDPEAVLARSPYLRAISVNIGRKRR